MSNGCPPVSLQVIATQPGLVPMAGGLPTSTVAPGTVPVVYDRTITVNRTSLPSQEPGGGVGDIGYVGPTQGPPAGADQQGEVTILSGIPAVIVIKAAGRTKGELTPSDIVWKPVWDITIGPGVVAEYGIRDRDIIIDDAGYRYGVAGAQWTSVGGWKLETVRLEA